ncbi:MAG TPA: pyridoxal kinase PdxY [Nocardioidaceae bacterium]|nr:pyridoxal kinase PdxY [Nocardioidaceae bacterium]
MNILSIQSSVAYGHVGNSAAVFPLQRLGIEVWPVMTVHFSNHTGYGEWRGPLLAAKDVGDVITGIDERGALAQCDAVLSGYQGAQDVGAVILDAVAKVKSQNAEAVYCCDPVMGDVGRGFFVRPGIPEFMRDQVVPASDIVTPNHFELDFLTGRVTSSLDDVLAAADQVRAMGPDTVLVTSVIHEKLVEGSLEMVAVTPEGAWSVTTPLLPITPNGAGDLTAALFLAHTLGNSLGNSLGDTLDNRDVGAALGRTASTVFTILEATAAAGEREIALVANQQAIANPSMQFQVTALR